MCSTCGDKNSAFLGFVTKTTGHLPWSTSTKLSSPLSTAMSLNLLFSFQSPSSRQSAKSPEMLDKELRAVMLRLMTQLLQVNTEQ